VTNGRSDAAFRSFELAGWQEAAAHYSNAFGVVTAQTIDSMLRAARVTAGVNLLDVASGPGDLAAAAAERGAIVRGVDFSSAMVAEAQRRHPAVTFAAGDAERLSFSDRTFDAVTMNFGMLHLAQPERAIAEAYRVLRPGGRYAFTVWAVPEQAIGFGAVVRAIETHGVMNVGLPEGPPFFRFSDEDECRRCLEGTGFAGVEFHQLPLVWRVASADVVFEAMMRGGVRTSAVLRAQTPEALARIRLAVSSVLCQYVQGDTLAIPMPAVLAAATRS
jgi:SAM-dependent methyltransferase